MKRKSIVFALLACAGSIGAGEGPVSVANAMLALTFDAKRATVAVTDKRTGTTWSQRSLGSGVTVERAQGTGTAIEARLVDRRSGLTITALIRLEREKPEYTLELAAEGALKQPLAFPHPFVSEPGTYLVVPMNEGIAYPVEDESIATRWLVAYGSGPRREHNDPHGSDTATPCRSRPHAYQRDTSPASAASSATRSLAPSQSQALSLLCPHMSRDTHPTARRARRS